MASTKIKILNILLLGTITMFFAEVLSGSTILWFISLPGLLITFPIYIIHAVFFLNLAIRTERLDYSGLYFIGVLYGGFEFWITTVPLCGYINTNPIMGCMLGVAILEYMALLYFWHPIMSVMSTFLVFNYLAAKSEKSAEVEGIPALNEFSPRTTIVKMHWLVILMIGVFICFLYSQLNVTNYLLGYFGTLGIIGFLTLIIKRSGGSISFSNIILSDRVFKILDIIIVLLYVLGFYIRSHFMVISPFPIIVLITYAIGVIGLKMGNKTGFTNIEVADSSYITWLLISLPFTPIVVSIISPEFAWLFGVASIFALSLLAIIYFIIAFIQIMKK